MKAKNFNGRDWQRDYTQGVDLVNRKRGQRIPKAVGPPRGVGGVQSNVFSTPNNHTFTTKMDLQKTLARYVLAGEGGSTGSKTLTALVYSPSDRLRLLVTVAFETDGILSSDPAFSVQPTWSIRAMSRNPQTGKESPLQLAYPLSGTANLPDSYEMDTAVTLLRVVATLQDTNFTNATVPSASARANAILICTWEPNEPIAPEELKRLYSLCSITYGDPMLITNNAV